MTTRTQSSNKAGTLDPSAAPEGGIDRELFDVISGFEALKLEEK